MPLSGAMRPRMREGEQRDDDDDVEVGVMSEFVQASVFP